MDLNPLDKRRLFTDTQGSYLSFFVIRDGHQFSNRTLASKEWELLLFLHLHKVTHNLKWRQNELYVIDMACSYTYRSNTTQIHYHHSNDNSYAKPKIFRGKYLCAKH